jgi:hypothetical protein
MRRKLLSLVSTMALVAAWPCSAAADEPADLRMSGDVCLIRLCSLDRTNYLY